MSRRDTTPQVPDLDTLPALLTRAEAASALRVSLRTLDRMIRAGRLPILTGLGRCPRIARSALERLLIGGGPR